MEGAFQVFQKRIEQYPFKPDMGLEALGAMLNQFWDQLTQQVTQGVSDTTQRDIYTVLMRQAKRDANRLNWLSKPEVYISAPSSNGINKLRLALPMSTALILIGLTLWFSLTNQPIPAVACGMALLLLTIYSVITVTVSQAPQMVTTRAEQRLNVAKIKEMLEMMVKGIDSDAQTLFGLITIPSFCNTIDGMDLAIAVLRSQYVAVEALPADAQSALERYLGRQRIEIITYTPEQAALFQCLPSNGERTIEPALVQNGKLLHRGVACVKEQ